MKIKNWLFKKEKPYLSVLSLMILLMYCCSTGNTQNSVPSTDVIANDSIGVFTDQRDGQTYKWIKMRDNRIWMAENLNYEMDNSFCYKKSKIIVKNTVDYTIGNQPPKLVPKAGDCQRMKNGGQW